MVFILSIGWQASVFFSEITYLNISIILLKNRKSIFCISIQLSRVKILKVHFCDQKSSIILIY